MLAWEWAGAILWRYEKRDKIIRHCASAVIIYIGANKREGSSTLNIAEVFGQFPDSFNEHLQNPLPKRKWWSRIQAKERRCLHTQRPALPSRSLSAYYRQMEAGNLWTDCARRFRDTSIACHSRARVRSAQKISRGHRRVCSHRLRLFILKAQSSGFFSVCYI